MANMENVLPLEFEGHVTKEPLVREAIVFGAARPVLGLLVWRSDESRELSDEEFILAIWPAVEKINSTTSPTARIQRQMIVPMPAQRTLPQTDKSTFIRARTYKEFEREIEMAYERLEEGSRA